MATHSTPSKESIGEMSIQSDSGRVMVGKRAAETLFFDYHREFGVRIKIVRIFNTYGPRMCINDGRVVSNFIVQALQGSPITMYGTGLQTRSFCYVSDLIDGIVALMNTPDSITGPVNLGNPGEFTMLELASKVIAFTNSNSPYIYDPLPKDDPKKRKPDISLANSLLNWNPKVMLDDGLKATIEYFQTIVPAQDSKDMLLLNKQ